MRYKNYFWRLFVVCLTLVVCLLGFDGLTLTVYAAEEGNQGNEMTTLDPVPYIYYTAPDNIEVRHDDGVCTDYKIVTEDTTTFEAGKWYVIQNSVAVDQCIEVIGNVNLILTNGTVFSPNKGIIVEDGNSLNIYAQSENEAEMGKLYAVGDYGHAGIGGGIKTISTGAITIHGGNVTAKSFTGGAGIGGGQHCSGGNVTIYAGIVNAYGTGGAGIGSGGGDEKHPGSFRAGSCTIYGGNVTATGTMGGAGIGGGLDAVAGADVAIYNGTVTARCERGNASGIGAGEGNQNNQGSLTLGEGVTFEAGYKEDDIAVTGDNSNATEAFCKYYFHSEYTGKTPVRYVYYTMIGDSLHPHTEYRKVYETITDNSTELGDGKWYVLSDTITINDRINVNGTANLILCDDTMLLGAKGITLEDGSTLNIYTQEKMNGMLVVDAADENNAAIGGNQGKSCGSINIHGGQIVAKWHNNGAAIGGGTGGSGGNVTMYAGEVQILSVPGGGAGIGGGRGGKGGTLSVYGGKITAYGGNNASAIGGGADCEDHGSIMLGDGVRFQAGNSESDVYISGGSTHASEALGNLYAEIIWDPQPVSYIYYEEYGDTTVRHEGSTQYFIRVTPDMTTLKDGNWYYLQKDISIAGRMHVKGSANLILGDGAKLYVGNGIEVGSGNILNIYAQSEGTEKGAIYAKNGGDQAGIGGNAYVSGGTVTIHGGNIETHSGYDSYGIGGGRARGGGALTIYGGNIKAFGGVSGTLTLGDGVTYGAGPRSGNITVFGDKNNASEAVGKRYFVTPYVHEHIYNQENTDVKYLKSEATCLDAAVYYKSCSCGEASPAETFTSGDPLGHTGGAATCQKRAVCSRCNSEYGEFAEHNYSTEYTIDEEPTCTTSGYKSRHCLTAGCTSKTDFVTLYSLGHDEVIDNGKPATCTETGLSRGMHCGRCNQVLVAQEVIPALGHDISEDWISNKSSHYHKCLRCGEQLDVENHVSSGAATEEQAEVCTICNYVINPPLEHTHNNLTKSPLKEASCKEYGTKEYYICRCGAWFFDNNAKNPIEDHGDIYIGKLLHIDKEIEGKPATCTNEGLTKGIKCEVCDEILIPQSVTPALGHKSIIGNKVEPTCTENGHEPDTICLTCNEVLVHGTVIQALGHTGGQVTCIAKAVCDRCHEEYGELAEHNYSDEYTFDEEPTCTTSGYKSRHCLTVGCTSKTDVVDYDPLGHVDGNEDQYCERCHKYLGYYIIQGADFRWFKGSNVEMIISSDAEYSKFINVLVDGETVDKNNYSSVSGSTVITFKADYLETLSLGTHTCRIVSTDGYAECEFYVLSKPVPPTPYVPPKTGIN